MAATTTPRPTPPVPVATAAPSPRSSSRRWLLRDLDRPSDLFANITPNWFASVMGTGIVAVAASGLPVQFVGLRGFAVGVWFLVVVLLVLVTAATVVHWVRHSDIARRHHLHPTMSHFYGAPPMALLTVGAATLLIGRDVIGVRAAVDVDWALWIAGTVTGLLAAFAVPYLLFTRHEVHTDSAFGGWLMPIVPPVVSATTGGLLVPHVAQAQLRQGLVLCCYAMLGLGVVASFVVITLIWMRLALHNVGEARMVPTLWIVLGPLGQSITAVNILGGVASLALPKPAAQVLAGFGLVYGVPVWGFALLWAGIAGAITARTVRDRLPFSLTWWSFTFPVGTCVTGTSQLALRTGSALFTAAAVAFFAALVLAWLVVAVRTARDSLRGRVFLPSPPAATPSLP